MGAKQKQLPGMEGTQNKELQTAILSLRGIDERIGALKEGRGEAVEKVSMEMKKVGLDFLRIQINEKFYEVELTRSVEKVKMKRASM